MKGIGKVTGAGVLVGVVTLLSGCVGGPPHDWYKPTGANPTIRNKGDVAIFQTSEAEIVGSIQQQLASGMKALGSSDWVGREPEIVELTKQAKKVGGSVVIFSVKHTETVSGVRPILIPNPPQIVTSQQT